MGIKLKKKYAAFKDRMGILHVLFAAYFTASIGRGKIRLAASAMGAPLGHLAHTPSQKRLCTHTPLFLFADLLERKWISFGEII